MKTDNIQKTIGVWVLVAVGLFVAWCVWQQKNAQQEIRETQRRETEQRENQAAAEARTKAETEKWAASPEGQRLLRSRQRVAKMEALHAEFDETIAEVKALDAIGRRDSDARERSMRRAKDLQGQIEVLTKIMRQEYEAGN